MISTQFPPAAFIFTNKGTNPIAVLTARSKFEVKVSYDRVYVQPGDSGIIYVKYESNQTGTFEEEVEVYFNTDSKPFKLRVSGNNVSVISCHPDPRNFKNREVRVIDAVTKAPIKYASCSFFSYNKNTPDEFKCDVDGKKRVELPIGMYDISISAPGYQSYQSTSMIPKSAPILYYELERSPEYAYLNAKRDNSVKETPKQKPVEKKSVDTIAKVSNPVKDTSTIIEKAGVLSSKLYKYNNIVFLVDVSNSMNSKGKILQLKTSMKTLFSALRSNDTVSIITYNYKSKVAVEASSGGNQVILNDLIDSLRATGLTDGVKGIEAAYIIAAKHKIDGGNNQVILATDGEFTGTQMSDEKMKQIVTDNFNNGIILSVVGFGDMLDAVEKMKALALLGSGSYIQIDPEKDVSSVLIDEIKSKSAKN